MDILSILNWMCLCINLQADKSGKEVFYDWKTWEFCRFVQYFQLQQFACCKLFIYRSCIPLNFRLYCKSLTELVSAKVREVSWQSSVSPYMLKFHFSTMYLFRFSALNHRVLTPKNPVSVSVQNSVISLETLQLAFVLLEVDETSLNICF